MGNRINFRGGSFDWKLKGIVPFVSQNWRRAAIPFSEALFSPNTSDWKCEIAILLKKENSSKTYNNASTVDTIPQRPGVRVVN